MLYRLPVNPNSVRQLTKAEFKLLDSMIRADKAYYDNYNDGVCVCDNKVKEQALSYAHQNLVKKLADIQNRIGSLFLLAIEMVVAYKTGRVDDMMSGYTLSEYINEYSITLDIPKAKIKQSKSKTSDFASIYDFGDN